MFANEARCLGEVLGLLQIRNIMKSYQVHRRVGTMHTCTKTNGNNTDKNTVLRKGYQHTNTSIYSSVCNKEKISSKSYSLQFLVSTSLITQIVNVKVLSRKKLYFHTKDAVKDYAS